MKCPYCNEEMRTGYIQGAQGIIFSERKKVLFIVKNPFNDKDKNILEGVFCASPAFYCDACDCLVWKKGSGETE